MGDGGEEVVGEVRWLSQMGDAISPHREGT
jgi:hypothetical protein